MFGNIFGGLSSLFDKLCEVMIKVKCRVNCCSKNVDHVSIPDKKISLSSTDTFKSLRIGVKRNHLKATWLVSVRYAMNTVYHHHLVIKIV